MVDIHTLRQINRNAPVPIYYQIKEILLEIIEGSEVGMAIPTIVELCNHFEVARPTVRQAIGELIAEGYLSSEKGRGTFVLKKKIDQNTLYTIQSFRAEMDKKGYDHRTVVLEIETLESDDHIANKLHLPLGKKIIKLRRLRIVDNLPLILLVDYLPEHIMHRVLEHDLERESLAHLIEQFSGYIITHSDRTITTRPAGEYEAKMLQIAKDSPLIDVEIITYIATGEPLHYALATYRGDRSAFSFTLKKEPSDSFTRF